MGVVLPKIVDLELGYAKHVGHDDFDVLTLNGHFWMGDIADGWAPFALLVLNQYDFKDSSNLAPSHSDKSIQVLFGLGVGKRILSITMCVQICVC